MVEDDDAEVCYECENVKCDDHGDGRGPCVDFVGCFEFVSSDEVGYE